MNNLYGIIGVLILAVISTRTVVTENDYYAGFRKPPPKLSWPPVANKNEFLSHRPIFDEQTRRRFQQHFQQQQQNQLYRVQPATEEMSGSGFTYQLPINYAHQYSDEVPFAVGPSNPKYYEKSDGSLQSDDTDALASSIYRITANNDNDSPVRLSSDGIPSYKLKAPMDINPKIVPFEDSHGNSNEVSKSKDVMTREDLQKLLENLQKKGQEEAIVNVYQNDVFKKHMELDAAMGMYVIALIAGVSAAVTVGLLAIGIGWYTLQKKAKAAADVEYPAYGVTGPNKDVSPSSGDRRLAQSAQMYHYQHQKQQIIAMENQNSGDQNGSLSDVETDEENEEGDYTVYECPGLAPTGEMEVKNPLFLDDPTPVQKNTSTQKPQHPPPQNATPQSQQQSNEKPKNVDPASKK